MKVKYNPFSENKGIIAFIKLKKWTLYSLNKMKQNYKAYISFSIKQSKQVRKMSAEK